MIPLFPISARLSHPGDLRVAGHDLVNLANEYGTPLYIFDAATVRNQVNRLNRLLAAHYPGRAAASYAAKAYFSLGMARRIRQLGLNLDVVSLGELRLAQRAGFDPRQVVMHGNNKSSAELEAALDWGIRAVVVDSLDELQFLENIARRRQVQAAIWLRITPGLAVETHAHVQTGHHASKFGIPIVDGQALEAIRRAQASPALNLTGLHTHLGSQLFTPEPFRQALDRLVSLAEQAGFIPLEINPGGGWGVPYTEKDPSDDPEPWVSAASAEVQRLFESRGWPLPTLMLEPGRWLVAQAGLAVYTVGVVKTAGDGTRFVTVDGGMADNPRTALYQAEYTARVIPTSPRLQDGSLSEVSVVGKFCESGDVLIERILLPEARRGDLLVMPVAGAYQLSMASNYNLTPRPAVLWVEEGETAVLQPREELEHGWWVEAAGPS
jgi:diaminopimelate decarboxylase